METLRLLPHPSNAFFLPTTTNACSLVLHQITGSSVRLSWSIRVIKRTADRLPVIDLFHWPTLPIKSIHVCFNKRLVHSIGHLLHTHQYGFRAGRSMSTPLFLLRRLTEVFKRHSASLYILFLDWSQAFDPIGHSHLAASLRRYGIPPLLVNAIMALYQNCRSLAQTLPATRLHVRWPVAYAKAALLALTFLSLFSLQLQLICTPSFKKFFPIPLGHSPTPIPLQMLNMLMIQSSLPEHTKHCPDFSTFFNIWPLVQAFSSMAQNAYYLLSMAHYQPLSPYMLMHIGPAIVHTVPHSFRFHLVKTLFVILLGHCKVLNISVLTLLLFHLLYQMLTFDVPRHPLPSKPWILFSDILSFPKKWNNGSTHKSFRLFLHGSESQLYFPDLSSTNHQNWQFTLQSSQTNIQDQEPTHAHPFYHRVILPSASPCSNECLLSLSFLYPFESQIPDWNI